MLIAGIFIHEHSLWQLVKREQISERPEHEHKMKNLFKVEEI